MIAGEMSGLALPTAVQLGLTYDGACPEFASHGFTGRNGIAGLYTRHGVGFGRPVFQWQARRWVRAVPMYHVTGEMNGRRPHSQEESGK
jgi:hypothetical protein